MLVLASCGGGKPPTSGALEVRVVGGVQSFEIAGANAVPEIPPWPFRRGGATEALISSSSSARCRLPAPLTSAQGYDFTTGGCEFLLTGGEESGPPPTVLDQWPDWGRNYLGAFSAVEVGDDVFLVTHGENKNDRHANGTIYLNTVNTDVGPECWSGYDADAGEWRECWESYNAFLALAVLGADGGVRDLGPIAWPTFGYVDDAGEKTSLGLRHPSSVVVGDHVYVYVQDESNESEGIKVFRAPLADLSNPHAFRGYDGDGGFTLRALPAGFTAAKVRSFYGTRGPRTPPLFDDPRFDSVRFSVAAIQGSASYLGVEERVNMDGEQLVLRLSSDLVHWSDPVVVPDVGAATWEDAPLNYPILVDAQGNIGPIDLSGFFVLGTHLSSPTRVQLSVTLR